MTKQQYEEFDNYQFLSEDDKDRQRDVNAKRGYGLSYNQMLTIFRKHKAARKVEGYYTMALIEYGLTDINFHSECGLLAKGKYDEAIRRVKEEMKSEQVQERTPEQESPQLRICNRCRNPVSKSDNPEYSYQCWECEADLYEFETSVVEDKD